MAQFSNWKVAQGSLQSGATLLHSGAKNKKTARDTLEKFERENAFDDLAKWYFMEYETREFTTVVQKDLRQQKREVHDENKIWWKPVKKLPK